MAALSTTPAFHHDCGCGRCRFRAHVQPMTGEAFDLIDGCDGSLIARTGDDGPDYLALPASLAPNFDGDTRTTMGRAFYVRGVLDKLEARGI